MNSCATSQGSDGVHKRGTPQRMEPAPRNRLDELPESPCSRVDTTRASGWAASLSNTLAQTVRPVCAPCRKKLAWPLAATLGGKSPRGRAGSGKVRGLDEFEEPCMTRLAFIGGGNMARSLIGGLLKTGVAPATLSVAEPLAESRQALGRDFGIA